MGTSAITVAGLTATASIRGNLLIWSYTDPNNGALPNIALDAVELWASTTNDRTTASKAAEGTTSARHDGLIEETTYYYWIKARNKLGNYGAWYPSGSTSGVSATAIGQSGLTFGIANGKLTVTQNSPTSNALTIAIKTIVGNDPSAGDPVFMALPVTTSGVGGYVIRQITAALSLTISNGSTLGVGSSFRLWFVLFDDGGTLRIGAVCLSNGGGFIYPLPASGVASSTAEGGAGAADTLAVIYTGIAVTSKPFRILGYADWNAGLSVSGQWSVAPDSVRLFGPGTPKPGDVVQDASTPFSPSGGGTTVIPFDNTIPQSTEGNATSFGVQLTPVSPINLFEFNLLFHLSCSVASPVIGAMFRDSAASAFATSWSYIGGTDQLCQLVFQYRLQAGDAAQRTYNFRVGSTNAGTLRAGSTSAGAVMNFTLANYHGMRELMG